MSVDSTPSHVFSTPSRQHSTPSQDAVTEWSVTELHSCNNKVFVRCTVALRLQSWISSMPGPGCSANANTTV